MIDGLALLYEGPLLIGALILVSQPSMTFDYQKAFLSDFHVAAGGELGARGRSGEVSAVSRTGSDDGV
jgi:hypothetical protein